MHVVHTINAPKGAITNIRQLRRHLQAGKPLFEGVCGHIRQISYDSTWSIDVPRIFGPNDGYRPLFLYKTAEHRAKDHDSASLNDRHVGSPGYNDNWWFDSLQAAEAYKLSRLIKD